MGMLETKGLPGRTVMVVLCWALLGGVGWGQDSSILDELRRLRRDMDDLQRSVYTQDVAQRQSLSGGERLSDAIGQFQVKIQNLEEYIRKTTGRIEELDHQMSRLNVRLDKLISDVDFRLQRVESGRGSALGSASGGALGGEGSTEAAGGESVARVPPPEEVQVISQGGSGILGQLSASTDSVSTETAALPVPAAAPEASAAAETEPLGPEELYKRTFGLLEQKEFDAARRDFERFLTLYPEHELAGNALYWMGETHYAQHRYVEAAEIFSRGYTNYPQGRKAAASLLKLALSLKQVNEIAPACTALDEFEAHFADSAVRLRGRVKQERAAMKCDG